MINQNTVRSEAHPIGGQALIDFCRESAASGNKRMGRLDILEGQKKTIIYDHHHHLNIKDAKVQATLSKIFSKCNHELNKSIGRQHTYNKMVWINETLELLCFLDLIEKAHYESAYSQTDFLHDSMKRLGLNQYIFLAGNNPDTNKSDEFLDQCRALKNKVITHYKKCSNDVSVNIVLDNYFSTANMRTPNYHELIQKVVTANREKKQRQELTARSDRSARQNQQDAINAEKTATLAIQGLFVGATILGIFLTHRLSK